MAKEWKDGLKQAHKQALGDEKNRNSRSGQITEAKQSQSSSQRREMEALKAELQKAQDECQDLRIQRDEKAAVCGDLQEQIDRLNGRTPHSAIASRVTADDHIVSMWNQLAAKIKQFVDQQELRTSGHQAVSSDSTLRLSRVTHNPSQVLSQDDLRPLLGEAVVWDLLCWEIFRSTSRFWGGEAGCLQARMCANLKGASFILLNCFQSPLTSSLT